MDFVVLNFKRISQGISRFDALLILILYISVYVCSPQNSKTSELFTLPYLWGDLLGCPMLRLCQFGLVHIPNVSLAETS